MQKSGISNDRGEYIMNLRALRANQHAEKCVNGTWLPMKVSEKSCVGGARAKFCDIVALRRKSKMANRDGEYCFSMVSFFLNFFFFFFCILKGVSGQSFGCLIPYDVGNVVILNNVSFLL